MRDSRIVFFEYVTIRTDTLPVQVPGPEAAFHVPTCVSIRGARGPFTGVNNHRRLDTT